MPKIFCQSSLSHFQQCVSDLKPLLVLFPHVLPDLLNASSIFWFYLGFPANAVLWFLILKVEWDSWNCRSINLNYSSDIFFILWEGLFSVSFKTLFSKTHREIQHGNWPFSLQNLSEQSAIHSNQFYMNHFFLPIILINSQILSLAHTR